MTRGLVQRVVDCLPERFRRAAYFRSLAFDPAELEGVELRVASTRGEREQAFRVLHDAYVKRGILAPERRGLRVTAHAVLPTTSTFVALIDGRVVATLSLIEDSPMGLPLESAFGPEVAALRASGEHLAEVGALAIASGMRKKGISLLLYNLMVRWALYARGVEALVIAVDPKARELYRTILLFEELGSPREYGGSLKNAPAIALRLGLKDVWPRYRRTYHTDGVSGQNPRANLFAFFGVEDFSSLGIPSPEPIHVLRETHACSSDDALHFLDADVLARTSPQERRHLLELWPELAASFVAAGIKNRKRSREGFVVAVPA